MVFFYVETLLVLCRLCLKCDGTCAETRFCLSAKQMSPFKSAGESVQSTTGSRGVRISGSNAGYTKFRGSVKGTGYPLHCQFPLHFPSHASLCAITFQLDSTHFNLPVNCILSKISQFYFAICTVCPLYKSCDCKLDKEIPTVMHN